MELTDSYTLPVDRQTVWNALNDPAVLKDCIAGCESFERTGDNAFACAVTASVGPVKARFTSKVTLSEIDAPNGYTLAFDGQGGVAGFGKGTARVDLVDEGGGTRLTYKANAQVGGKLAQVGSRLIDAAAKKMAGDFFSKFSDKLGGSKAPAPAADAHDAHSASAGLGQPDTHFPLWLKVIGTVGVVAILYIFTHH
ncbi:MAG: carbon monoxide dehydrogenase subunit G [Betaproteobacteria bacterium]|nr:carbon monoxide dehydrogenase subunit G [Betaproteobacteria bacterium]